MMKIGNIKLKKGLVLSPMMEVTNLPYRLVCRKAGAEIAYTEMINVPAMLHTNPKTLSMMKTTKEDSPIGIQITDDDNRDFEKVIPILKKYDLVDINCGCPSNRTTEQGSGSYLLLNPDNIAGMIKSLKKHDITATVKVRLGFKKNNVLSVAKRIEKAGADAITVHGRLANQKNDVKSDSTWIKKVKNSLGIPVIGNGDVFDEEGAAKMLDICDGVMIARGAIGDPLIFDRVSYYLRTGKKKTSSFSKKFDVFLDYLKLSEKYKMVNLPSIKYIGSKVIKDFKNAAKLRDNLMVCKDLGEVKKLFKVLRQNP